MKKNVDSSATEIWEGIDFQDAGKCWKSILRNGNVKVPEAFPELSSYCFFIVTKI